MSFNFDWLPMREAAQLDGQAEACCLLAEHSQWRIVKWWYHRKAAKLKEGADIWRGLEWRTKQAIERQMNHAKHCPGDMNEHATTGTTDRNDDGSSGEGEPR